MIDVSRPVAAWAMPGDDIFRARDRSASRHIVACIPVYVRLLIMRGHARHYSGGDVKCQVSGRA